jgi:hypothetical protein
MTPTLATSYIKLNLNIRGREIQHDLCTWVMLRRLINRQTLPQVHRLVAYASYPARSLCSWVYIKKSPIFIPSTSSSPSAASCGYPRPGRGHALSLLLLLPPYPPLLARPHRARLTPLPVVHDGAGGARSAYRTCHPPDRTKPDAGDTCGSGSRARRLCWMLVVLAHGRSLSAPP